MTHPLLEQLASGDPQARCEACRAAAADPAGALLAPALGRVLGDPEKAVMRAASDALVEIGRRAGAIDDVLREALRADDPARRWGAAYTFARVEAPAPRLLPALVEALASDDGDVRWAAARILVDMGRLHGEVLPLLTGLVQSDPRPGVRRMAIHTLRKLAADADCVAEALLAAAGDDAVAVRRAALTAISGLIDPPQTVMDRLVSILEDDPDPASRRLAALALGELGARTGLGDPVRRELATAARSGRDADLKRAAASARRRAGGAGPRVEEST